MSSSAIDIKPLTGFRGVAATSVFIFHMSNQAGDIFCMWKPIPAAQLMVDAFFLMSGHILCHVYASSPQYQRNISWKDFYISRFSRIYPLHLLSMTLLLGLFCVESIMTHSWSNITGDARFSIWGSIKELLLLQAFPDRLTSHPWIYTSWSISIEWWLYILVFPLIFFLIVCNRKLLFLVTAILMTSNIVWLYFFSNDSLWTNGWTAWLRGISGIMSGACLWVLQHHYKTINKQKGITTDVALGLFLVLNILLSALYRQPPWLLICILPMVVNGLCTNNGIATRWLSTPTAVMAGNISYSVYLLHPLILLIMKQACTMGLVKNVMVYMILSTFAVFSIAIVTYLKFEVPLRDALKRRLSKGRMQSETFAKIETS